MTRTYALAAAFVIVLAIFNIAAGMGWIGWVLYGCIVGWIGFQLLKIRRVS